MSLHSFVHPAFELGSKYSLMTGNCGWDVLLPSDSYIPFFDAKS